MKFGLKRTITQDMSINYIEHHFEPRKNDNFKMEY